MSLALDGGSSRRADVQNLRLAVYFKKAGRLGNRIDPAFALGFRYAYRQARDPFGLSDAAARLASRTFLG